MSKLKGLLLTEGLHGMISQVEGLAKALDLDYFHEKIELNIPWNLTPPFLIPAKKFVFSRMAFGWAIGLARSIDYLNTIGVKNIFDYNMQLCDILIEGLQSRNAVINSPLDKKNGSSIITAYFDGVDTETIIKSLKAAQIFVSNRAGSIRFSPHLYNNDIDIETTLTELDNII